MYILYDLEHDLNQCSSPWVNLEGEAEVEFVRIILDQCELCLKERFEEAKQKYPHDSILRHHAAFVSVGEIATLIRGYKNCLKLLYNSLKLFSKVNLGHVT